MKAFQLIPKSTVNISVSASSQRVLVTSRAAAGPMQVRVWNNGTASVWFAFGDATVVADGTTDAGMGSGGTEVFTVSVPDGGALYMAAIAAGSTGSIYVTPGVGI